MISVSSVRQAPLPASPNVLQGRKLIASSQRYTLAIVSRAEAERITIESGGVCRCRAACRTGWPHPFKWDAGAVLHNKLKQSAASCSLRYKLLCSRVLPLDLSSSPEGGLLFLASALDFVYYSWVTLFKHFKATL